MLRNAGSKRSTPATQFPCTQAQGPKDPEAQLQRHGAAPAGKEGRPATEQCSRSAVGENPTGWRCHLMGPAARIRCANRLPVSPPPTQFQLGGGLINRAAEGWRRVEWVVHALGIAATLYGFRGRPRAIVTRRHGERANMGSHVYRNCRLPSPALNAVDKIKRFYKVSTRGLAAHREEKVKTVSG